MKLLTNATVVEDAMRFVSSHAVAVGAGGQQKEIMLMVVLL